MEIKFKGFVKKAEATSNIQGEKTYKVQFWTLDRACMESGFVEGDQEVEVTITWPK